VPRPVAYTRLLDATPDAGLNPKTSDSALQCAGTPHIEENYRTVPVMPLVQQLPVFDSRLAQVVNSAGNPESVYPPPALVWVRVTPNFLLNYGCISMLRYWSSLRYSSLRTLFLLAADLRRQPTPAHPSQFLLFCWCACPCAGFLSFPALFPCRVSISQIPRPLSTV